MNVGLCEGGHGRLKTGFVNLLAGAAVLLTAGSALSQQVREERVRFDTGSSSATLEDSITGHEIVDYVFGARGGQEMSVSFETDHVAGYFNVLPPDSGTALFVGSAGGTEWKGLLPDDGDYRIRVYLMGSAARRDEAARYMLSVGITGDPPTGAPASDAKIPGTPYHARGPVSCSIGPDEEGSSECEFSVIRGAPGTAEVHLVSPGGEKRVIRFTDGVVSTPDPDVTLTVEKRADEWAIGINEFEFYIIPQAVVYGG